MKHFLDAIKYQQVKGLHHDDAKLEDGCFWHESRTKFYSSIDGVMHEYTPLSKDYSGNSSILPSLPIIFFPATLSFKWHTISSTSPSQQNVPKEQIFWGTDPLGAPVNWWILIQSTFGIVKGRTISSVIRGGNDRLFRVLSDHRHPFFRNLNSTHQWWRYFIVWVKYTLGSFLWEPYGISLLWCLSLFRPRGSSELLPSPPWITSKRLSYDLQTKRLFLKFICGQFCGHFQVVLTCTLSLTLPWQPSFDSHVCQNVYLLR